MNIDLDNANQILSHCLLHDTNVAVVVAETPEWKDDGKITAKVSFNGIELPGEVMEKVLQDLIAQVREHYKERYDVKNINALVLEKAKLLIEEKRDDLLSKLSDIENKLNLIDGDLWYGR